MAWVSRNRSYNPSILGVMTGLAGMDQGRGLDVVPAMSMNRQITPASSATDTNVEPTVERLLPVHVVAERVADGQHRLLSL